MDREGCAYPHSSGSSTGSGPWASRERCGCGCAMFVCRPGGGSARLAARRWRGACSWRSVGGGSWWESSAGRGSGRAGRRCSRPCYQRRCCCCCCCCCCRCRRRRQSRADGARVACLPCGGWWSVRSGFEELGSSGSESRVRYRCRRCPTVARETKPATTRGSEFVLTFRFHAGLQGDATDTWALPEINRVREAEPRAWPDESNRRPTWTAKELAAVPLLSVLCCTTALRP